jgi:hypothetical protein
MVFNCFASEAEAAINACRSGHFASETNRMAVAVAVTKMKPLSETRSD